jgi:hypothetical protein
MRYKCSVGQFTLKSGLEYDIFVFAKQVLIRDIRLCTCSKDYGTVLQFNIFIISPVARSVLKLPTNPSTLCISAPIYTLIRS